MSDVFKAMKIAPKAGQVRRKMWRSLTHVSDPETDPTWRSRCAEYWERQARVYGVKFDAVAIYYDPELLSIKTLARVERVLLGLRV